MKLKFFNIFFASTLFLVGCQMNDTDNTRDQDEGAIQPTRYEDQQDRQQRTQDGVRNRTRTDDTRMNRNRSNDRFADDRTTDRDRRNTDQRSDDSRYDVSKEAADKITDQIEEIDQAYVLTTNNNAYVAVKFDHDRKDAKSDTNNRSKNRTNQQSTDRNDDKTNNRDTDVDDEVKSEISDIVQSEDDNIDNVYVSTNPDFIDLTNDYIDDFNEGRPVRGLFDQMGDMINRLFPQNRR